ncbi:alpha-mannosidase [Scopulibacillus darangshiensis]|uniref:Alpha-mannosidase n=1 Tax=Scopulibacillus darangshiensis TaxID=442528 RepID=A0A4R2NJD3_9BACL|nr:glycoside hydrolase family 38 C-terminal domain-containing protein [Scopulibacillus darangshiensis]TCP21335.1 alpha-mannosidase [Scopulibacillus darangshiensis]
MPYENVSLDRLTAMKEQIAEKIYQKVSSLSVNAWVTNEPVSFENRKSGSHISVVPGDKWGGLWDCAWFHFEGLVPRGLGDQKVVLIIDINGELCLVDKNGTPVQGLTNVNSEFDYELGKPGKRIVDLSDITADNGGIDLWADAGCNDLFGHFRSGTLKEADVAVCNEEVRNLYYDVEVLLDFAEQLDEQSVRRAKILQALYDVSLLLVNWNDLTIKEARTRLFIPLDKKNGDAELTISAIGHAHIDLAWLWPIRETIRKGARTFATALRNMEKYPDYIFGASQPQLYQWIKDHYPSLYTQIKERIEEGRWEVQGAMWVEPDANISGGEALVRQILYGKQFFQSEFGKEMKVLWVPDIFGYTASLPQILQKSGVDYVMTQKLSWSTYNDHPHHTFLWEGIDGSKVLTHLPPEDTYNGPAAPRSIIKIEKEYKDKNVSNQALMLFGIGDGGGGPGEEHLERLQRERNLLGLSPVVQEPSINFFEKLNHLRDKYKTWRGELYLEKHQGTLTTQARNKKYNRQLEKALRELEFAASLLSIYQGADYPKKEIDDIWKEVLLYQFHDILPGSSISRVYEECLERYAEILDRVNVLIKKSYENLAKNSAQSGLFIFNSLPWERKEWIKYHDEWQCVTIPSMGYAIVDNEHNAAPQITTALVAKDHILENDILRLTFNVEGAIQSIYDKENDRECLTGPANSLSIYHDSGDAWDFPTNYHETKATVPKIISLEMVQEGPYVMAVTYYEVGLSNIKQTVRMTLGSRKVDFQTSVDWREKEKMLRSSFPVNVYSENVNCEIQFGYIKRQTHRNTQWDFAKDEISAHHWIDLSEPNYGVALLNDSKYGHRVHDNVLDLNLLRSPNHPDPLADQAVHEFTYSLYPHPGDFVQADVYKEGYELNVPTRHLEIDGQNHSLVNAQSFIQLNGKGVMLEAVKQAEDGKGFIIRLYETAGTHTSSCVVFDFEIQTAFETDLMEKEIRTINHSESRLFVKFQPFEIKTIKVQVLPKE